MDRKIAEKVLLTMNGIRLPHDPALEKRVLNEVMYNEGCRNMVFSKLRKWMFWNEDYSVFFGIYRYFHEKHITPSVDMVMRKVMSLGLDAYKFSELIMHDYYVTIGQDLVSVCDTLINLYTQRRIIQIANTAMYSSSLPSSVADVAEILDQLDRSLKRVKNVQSTLHYDDIDKYRYDPHKPIRPFNPFLCLDDGYELKGVCEKNVMVAVTGYAGAGKSYILSQLITGLMKGYTDNEPKFCRGARFTETPKVLWIDTEQNDRDFALSCKRIELAVGDSFYGNFEGYRMDELTDSERFKNTDALIRKYDPDIVVLDNISDMIEDYNNKQMAIALMGAIMNWRSKGNRMIIGVLHLNKGSDKMRGHLGTEFENKCEVRLRVDKQQVEMGVFEGSKLSNLKNRQTREFPPIDFTINKAIPEGVEFEKEDTGIIEDVEELPF